MNFMNTNLDFWWLNSTLSFLRLLPLISRNIFDFKLSQIIRFNGGHTCTKCSFIAFVLLNYHPSVKVIGWTYVNHTVTSSQGQHTNYFESHFNKWLPMHFLRKHRAFRAQEVLNVFVAILRGTSSSKEPTRSERCCLRRDQIRPRRSAFN